MRRIASTLAATICLAALFFGQAAYAQVVAPPNAINFQARLATLDGNPVLDGTYNLRFRFYDAATAGNLKYDQDFTNAVVKNGIVAVLIAGFTADKFDGNTWLGISINGATELMPRTQIVSVPYALKANLALTVPNNSITNAKIVAGTLTADRFASGVLNSNVWFLGGNSGTNATTQFLGTSDVQPLVLRTNNVERMRILGNGNVGIGTINPAARLHVSGDAYITGSAFINGINFINGNADFDGNVHVGGNVSVRIMPFGDHKNVQWNDVSKVLYYDNSSRKHKRDITPLVDDFNLLLQAQSMTYTRPDAPGRWEIGYIAEDFDKIGLKKLVDYGKGGEVEGINYEKICLYLTEIAKKQQQTLQNQQQILQSQRKDIEDLRGQVEKLTRMMEREKR